ncbi:hypothetical protein A9Q86_01995 [Flavobacteriales bacterium 33_180_T64]|nr:hypothetical protein A9Q86_01995 [Flavobacteriales bacterium 33_180_T64]
MLQKLYPYRFETFFFSQIAILFGALIFPSTLFENSISPILFLVNLLAGILLLSKKKKLSWFLIVLLIIVGIVFSTNLIEEKNATVFNFIRMAAYFLFYVVVTYEIIMQVWNAKFVNKNVIFGLISGYIALGLIGFFICLSIEMAHPNSFEGLLANAPLTDSLMYYSYITLLTIGYGDILPVTSLAQKATILIGLVGQIYLVVITAIVVGKYINQSSHKTTL